MKFKLVESLNNNDYESFILEKEYSDKLTKDQKRLVEYSTSREWQHTKDNTTFAIIGSRDKDTGEDRWDELQTKFSKLCLKGKTYKEHGITYRIKEGRYTYSKGELKGQVVAEYSLQIFNITKEDAMTLAKEINQESIIWKDDEYFGFIDVETGKESIEFRRCELGIDNKGILGYSSKETNNNLDNFTGAKGRRYYYKDK